MRNVEKTHLRLVFSTFPTCSQISVMFYHSAIHGLGFFICQITLLARILAVF